MFSGLFLDVWFGLTQLALLAGTLSVFVLMLAAVKQNHLSRGFKPILYIMGIIALLDSWNAALSIKLVVGHVFLLDAIPDINSRLFMVGARAAAWLALSILVWHSKRIANTINYR
jgi:hypothetical protein